MGTRTSERVRCEAHLQWVRGCCCSILGKLFDIENGVGQHSCSLTGDRIEAAHVRRGTDGGMSLKPGDDMTLPLCATAHHEQHQIGEAAFERKYHIDMKAIAAELWDRSPAGRKYRERIMQRTRTIRA